MGQAGGSEASPLYIHEARAARHANEAGRGGGLRSCGAAAAAAAAGSAAGPFLPLSAISHGRSQRLTASLLSPAVPGRAWPLSDPDAHRPAWRPCSANGQDQRMLTPGALAARAHLPTRVSPGRRAGPPERGWQGRPPSAGEPPPPPQLPLWSRLRARSRGRLAPGLQPPLPPSGRVGWNRGLLGQPRPEPGGRIGTRLEM